MKSEFTSSQEDLALQEMTGSTSREAQEQAIAATLGRQEHLCELIRSLVVLASASTLSGE